MRNAYLYIISNKSHRLYVGITSDLWRRFQEHRTGSYPNAFTARYRFTRLVYYETAVNMNQAAAREKEIKSWRRQKKVALIQSLNPNWLDLSVKIDPARLME
jgi:putative endonuclease